MGFRSAWDAALQIMPWRLLILYQLSQYFDLHEDHSSRSCILLADKIGYAIMPRQWQGATTINMYACNRLVMLVF